jgi:hypothetical protein
MAVAAPARRTAPAPAPSRTTPPKQGAPPRKAAAPARTAPRRKAAPARKSPARKAPARHSPRSRVAARTAPARRAPARAPSRVTTRTRAVGGQLLPFASRTAVAVGQLPDSGLVVRMTRGRTWIAVLGVLLAGIVTLNVITLSFAASTGDIDSQITTLEQENSILRGRDARLTSVGPVRQAAAPLGLAMPASEDIHFSDAGHDDVATAAQRLAAASPE